MPLGLTHTLLGTNNSQSQSYQYHNHEIVTVGKGAHQLGDGCIVMNLTDLIKYSQAVINQRLLKSQTWRLAFDLKFGKYGMGWMKINSWFWHSGQILGYWSDFFLAPDRQTAMVWLYNISPSGDAEKQWLNATDAWRESYLSWLNQ